MDGAGYMRTPDKEDADLGLQLSYVASTYYFNGYYNNGPWWNYYPGYWIPGYWGGSLNVNRATTAINQAFAQSPYLKK